MPIRNLDESEIKRIAAKYIHDVESKTIPNIRELIENAIRKASPERQLDQQDVHTVISQLVKKSKIDDQVIIQEAKKQVDHAALEDLKHQIQSNARQLKHKISDDEVDLIIRTSKLTPNKSILQIRKAVQQYFSSGRPLEYIPPTELQKMIRDELQKVGPVDERDVRAILEKYIEGADPDKPLDVAEMQRIIKGQMEGRKASPQTIVKSEQKGQGPAKSQTSRIATPKEKEEQKLGKDTKNDVKAGAWVPPKDPTNLTFFEKIRFKLRRYGIKSLSRGARNWLTDEVTTLSKSQINRKKLLQEGETVAEAMIGKMFMYFYNAKTKDVLPYWDKFPLVICIELYNDGWLGLNLHYLDYRLRMKLFDKLLQYANDKSLDKITKLRLSYGLLKSVAKFPEVRPTIKRYLASYVKSELLPIDAIDWEIALFLPVSQFQKERRETVWEKSRAKIEYLKRFRRK
jgi:predicted transcriptional regulator